MLAPPWKPSSLSSRNSAAATNEPRNTPGTRPRSKVGGLSVREQHARQHLGRRAGEAQRLDRVRVERRPATDGVGGPPGARRCVRPDADGTGPAPGAARAGGAPTRWPRPATPRRTAARRHGRCRCVRSGRARRRRRPSTTRRCASRSGASAPVQAACAVTANTRPDITERRLPCAASTSRRLEQPRARIMPMPNSAPPMAAPDRLPRAAIWRASLASNAPSSDERLRGQHRGGEGEQPDRQLAAGEVARELDHRRAQAEARALREEAEGQADEQAGQARQRRRSRRQTLDAWASRLIAARRRRLRA